MAILVLAAIAWPFRESILVGVAVGFRNPVAPHREVDWDVGPPTSTLLASERPPNIVLILADDLGWNDLRFGGGGVANGSVPTPNIDSIAAEGVQFTRGYAANGTGRRRQDLERARHAR